MFRMPKPNMIESDAGFSVEHVQVNKLAYREGDRQVTCTLEYYGGGPLVGIVYLAEYSDCWDPPFETVRISDEGWRQIGNNIREAYRSQGLDIEFTLTPPEQREALKRALEELRRPSRPPDLPGGNRETGDS